MRGFEDKGSKGHFSAKKGALHQKTPGGKQEFFSKIRLEHFSHQDVALCRGRGYDGLSWKAPCSPF